MKKIKSLDGYQKIILLITFAMILVFTVLYPNTISKEGFAYNDVLLIPQQENGNTVYSGKIKGKQAEFVISADKVIRFQYGDKTYGPYTVKEDATAIPEQSDMRDRMTGIEVYCGNKVMFRGGVVDWGDNFLFYNEDGSEENIHIYAAMSDGTLIDADGNVIDPMEPSVSTIIELLQGPKLTHKGLWAGWFGGVIICLINVVTVFFADELFRLNMAFRVRDVDRIEPSDWEMAGRYVSWIGLPIIAAIIFYMGLQWIN